MKVIVTGGLGYIGSHTCIELIESGHEVLIVDDLSNSSIDILDGISSITGKKCQFEQIDLKDGALAKDLFDRHKDCDGVIHFAAYKAVGESVKDPLAYYENNLISLIHIIKALMSRNHPKLIFSSSCTVYGQADNLPIRETAPFKEAESPYGNTKQIGEEMISDICTSNPKLQAISLRYFNPIGAHPSAKIGESPQGVPQNLVPYITQTAAGIREKLYVFGNDYPTADGTCVRDYIHVVDLAKAHVAAIRRLIEGKNTSNYEVYNIGTGSGNSVLEVIRAFEEATGIHLNYEFTDRRKGDVIAAYADTQKANDVLGWSASHSLKEALSSAWAWEKAIRNL